MPGGRAGADAEAEPSGCADVQPVGIRGHLASAGTVRTTAIRHASGLGPGPDLGDLSARTVEACVTGDTVCANDGSSDLAVHRKADEKPAVARAIADAAADVLG